jgi:hypothetical protein
MKHLTDVDECNGDFSPIISGGGEIPLRISLSR